jgi:flavin reductase ActVB
MMTGTVPVDGAAFRSAMALLAAPVTVVTGRTAEGDPFGFTASAVTSLSLDPPLLLICVNRGANSHDPLVRASSFCVNVLDDEAENVALHFGSSRSDKFDGVPVECVSGGVPSLRAALVRVVCTAYGVHDGGDHSVVTGLVVDVYHNAGSPLLWWNRGFARIAR